MADPSEIDLTTLTVQLLSAYVSNNSVASTDLAGLIQSTRAALAPTSAPVTEPAAEHVPAVTLRKSLASRDAIISMIDGKPYQTLKRHLSGHGLTPADYIARYNLPRDYPMVAPAYSDRRREVAKRLGLGRKAAVPVAPPIEAEAPPSAIVAEPAVAPAKRRPGRPKAATSTTEPPAKPAPKAKRAKPAPVVDAPIISEAIAPAVKPAAKPTDAVAAAPEKRRRGRPPAAAKAN